MRRLLSASLLALAFAAPSYALGQPTPPPDAKKPQDDKKPADAKKPAVKPADAKKPADEAKPATAGDKEPAAKDDDLEDEDEPSSKKSEPAPASEKPAASDAGPLLPSLGEPRPAEQEPAPYTFEPGPLGRERHVDVGPDFGVWMRAADSDTVSYAPGFAWGVHARADLLSFLGFRAYVNSTKHPVTITSGQFRLAGTAVDQPSLTVFQLGARLEPTWVVMPTFRLFAGFGIAWGRATAPQPTTSGTSVVAYADRSGVFLETSGTIGATWDVIPHWLAASLMVTGGVLTAQSGDMFQDEQVIDQTGTMKRIAGLPRFKNSGNALLGIGMLL